MAFSSVRKTMEVCRKQGRRVAKVEQFITHGPDSKIPGFRHDAFGFIDILAIDPKGIVAIQACASGRAEHERKILANHDAKAWLLAGGTIELWSWSKRKVKRGGKAMRWHCRVDNIIIGMFQFRKDAGNGRGDPKQQLLCDEEGQTAAELDNAKAD